MLLSRRAWRGRSPTSACRLCRSRRPQGLLRPSRLRINVVDLERRRRIRRWNRTPMRAAEVGHALIGALSAMKRDAHPDTPDAEHERARDADRHKRPIPLSHLVEQGQGCRRSRLLSFQMKRPKRLESSPHDPTHQYLRTRGLIFGAQGAGHTTGAGFCKSAGRDGSRTTPVSCRSRVWRRASPIRSLRNGNVMSHACEWQTESVRLLFGRGGQR